MATRCVGGPLCGCTPEKTPYLYAYIDPSGKCWNTPAPDRGLYFFEEDWQYLGSEAYICSGCNALIQPAKGHGEERQRARESCPLCGASTGH